MAERRIIGEASVPGLGNHIKLRFNEQRQQWVIQAPEKVLVPDETAVEILKLCDGKITVGGIVDALAAKFAAPREVIGKDVTEMLQDLSDKGVIVA
jgi:pyrroloquinoline quinone biosynthesis protein D